MSFLMRGDSFKVSAQLRRTLKKALRDDLIVTPLLDEWLVNHPNATISPEVAKRIAEVMSTPQRDRRFTWSASSSGMCLRRQELAFLGAPAEQSIPAETLRIFNNGTWIHLRWQALLLTAGILDSIEVAYHMTRKRARCSMDGMGVAQISRYKGETFGFELKGRNDFTYSQQRGQDEPDEKTRRQVDFEFYLSGLDVFVIVNENKNNQSNTEWVFYRDENRIAEVVEEINSLNKAIDRERLHPMIPECNRQLAGGEFYKCPFGGKGGTCQMAGNWPTVGRNWNGKNTQGSPTRHRQAPQGTKARRILRRRTS